MNKIISLFLFIMTVHLHSIAQNSTLTHEDEIVNFQKELNEEFSNPDKSPLTKQGFKKFQKLEYFPIVEKFRVKAKFIRTEKEKPFKMPTTIPREAIYVKYGEAYFDIDGISYKLNLYQSHQLKNQDEYKDYLFLPFTDLTNGEESYAGGRFIDLKIPEGDTITIDFNKAYNPYCAYNHKYSCPIPPTENHIEAKVQAGVKRWKK